MWLLEAAGDVFSGRRLWLRPGKAYLFGRTDSGQGPIVITHKTVSRKHLTITVDSVEDGDAHDADKRSRVKITDLGTKSGTTINGETIKGADHVVRGDVTTLIVGRFEQEFYLKWHPVVLFFSFTPRELQADPMGQLRQTFEQFDIKVTTRYNDVTTHLVVKKRNTSKGLQALIDAKYIVYSTFLDAVLQACRPLSDEDPTSALEADFDGNWPSELDHLPPRSKEASDRPVGEYSPDPGRADVFDGYTYVFYDKAQFDSLLPAIAAGKGKALLHAVVVGQTSVDDLVRYVKAVAGEKGLGSFEDGSEGKGVVVVRYTPSKGDQVDWYRVFFESVSLRLDHRLMDQGEFLEAILRKEPGILRRPLQDAEEGACEPVAPGGSGVDAKAGEGQTQQSGGEEPTLTRRGRARRPIKRYFAGFDDGDEDMKTDVVVTSMSPPLDPMREASPDPVPGSGSEPLSQGLFVQPEAPPLSNARPGRKRAASPLPDQDLGDLMDAVAPTAAARKRRRIAAGEDIEQETPVAEEPTKVEHHPPKTKPKPPVDPVEATVRKRQEEEEALRRAEREVSSSKVAQMTEDDLAAIRALAIVEEMEVVPLSRRPLANKHDDGGYEVVIAGARWDDRWNGRKNFKRFRRQGQEAGRRHIRGIVEVVEAKEKAGAGMGDDDYWLDASAKRQHPKGNAVIPQTNPSIEIENQRLGGGTHLANRSAPRPGPRVVMATPEVEDDLFVPATAAGSWESESRARRYNGSGGVGGAVPVDDDEDDEAGSAMLVEETPDVSLRQQVDRDSGSPDHHHPAPYAARATTTRSGGTKRGATASLAREQPARKRQRPWSPAVVVVGDESDDDDGGRGGGGDDDSQSGDDGHGNSSDGSMKFVFRRR